MFRSSWLFGGAKDSPAYAAERVFIGGRLPASSVLHLAGQSDHASALILTSDRAELASALVTESDTSLTSPGLARRLARVEIKIIPTAVHLRFYLLTLPPPTATLVILHEPSIYVSRDPTSTSSAYTSLLALFVDSFPITTQLVVLDRNASALMLPLAPPDSKSSPSKRNISVPLDRLAEALGAFDRIGTVEIVPQSPTAVDARRIHFLLSLRAPTKRKGALEPLEEVEFTVTSIETEERTHSEVMIVS